ncbi:MFS transporter [Pseudonocardia acaciae]|uniref:MFS transporter n=1 Tax=Pseudonocardia acaciae TaxID=551276 RepID=UPI00048E827D|nr:MFS transporter [Pseudonocardia acaciae]
MTTSGASPTLNSAAPGRPAVLAISMYAVLLLSYVINAMDRQLFPTIAKDVGTQFGFNLAQVGLQSTIFTLGMGVAGIPTGFLLARSSRKTVALAGLALFSAATLLTAYSVGFWDMLGYRFLSGLGEAMQLTALLAIATGYFVRNRAFAVGAINFTFGVGALVGPNLGAALRDTGGWWHPLIVFGVVGFVILVLVALVVRPWLTEARGQDTAHGPLEDFGAPRLLARNPMLLGASTVFAGLAIYAYLGLYPTYLREALHYTAAQAGLAVSMYGLGAFFSLVGGWLGDRVDFRRLLAVALVISAVAGYVLFSGTGEVWVHLVLSFVYGAAISGVVYANLAAGIIKSVKRSVAAHGSGLFVASIYIPAAFSGYLFGKLVGGVGWTGAALIQICAFCVVAAGLALAARRASPA